MEIPLRGHHLIDADRIRVPEVLACFTRKANIREMLEAQTFVTLPLFLKEFALSQYDAMAGITLSTETGMNCWLEAVQYLLISYA